MTLKNQKELSLSTKIAQALHYNDPDTGSVVPPVEHTATYSRDENYEPRKAYWYRRDGNKTTQIAEEIIAELENADMSLLFSTTTGHGREQVGHLSPPKITPRISFVTPFEAIFSRAVRPR